MKSSNLEEVPAGYMMMYSLSVSDCLCVDKLRWGMFGRKSILKLLIDDLKHRVKDRKLININTF